MPNTGRIHDRDLLDFLEGREPQKYQGEIWRVTWSTRNPLVGSRAGGRWHPPNSFEALYTSVGEDGTLAEVYFHLSRAPVFSSSDMQIYCLAIETVNTIALDSECLSQLGIDEKNLGSMEYERSQVIGAAAQMQRGALDNHCRASPR